VIVTEYHSGYAATIAGRLKPFARETAPVATGLQTSSRTTKPANAARSAT
jgi:hypothetical protein